MTDNSNTLRPDPEEYTVREALELARGYIREFEPESDVIPVLEAAMKREGEMRGVLDGIRAALLHASQSIHHPACPAPKNAGNGCTCHIQKVRAALESMRERHDREATNA